MKISGAFEIANGTGYRNIDTAAAYGIEKEIGEGIAKGMKKYGVKREELFITKKVSVGECIMLSLISLV